MHKIKPVPYTWDADHDQHVVDVIMSKHDQHVIQVIETQQRRIKVCKILINGAFIIAVLMFLRWINCGVISSP